LPAASSIFAAEVECARIAAQAVTTLDEGLRLENFALPEFHVGQEVQQIGIRRREHQRPAQVILGGREPARGQRAFARIRQGLGRRRIASIGQCLGELPISEVGLAVLAQP
jgi:hypothetical protein